MIDYIENHNKTAEILLYWYENNKRTLPWRNTQNPYKIWVSEIILQQTKVAQGLPYYINFLKNFPTLKHLAEANENEVLIQWQGLGYYSRARNLHFTAKYIYKELGGVFPNNYIELIKLKGIGDYTASAIASFSFGEITPVLDGNVYRFISRLFGVDVPINTGKSIKIFKKILFQMIIKENPGTFNQAIMEFGSLQCVPKKPNCQNCVFIDICYAYKAGVINSLPVKNKHVKSINRYFTYYLVKNTRCFILKKRTDNGIWKNLYEFPMSESIDIFESETLDTNIFSKGSLGNFKIKKIHGIFKHVLSHQNIFAKLIEIEIGELDDEDSFKEVKIGELKNFPIHQLMVKMLDSVNIEL